MEETLSKSVVRGHTARSVVASLELMVPAHRESLDNIRTHTIQFLRAQLGEAMKRFPMDEVMLAVQEACANVVRHAYKSCEVPGILGLRTQFFPGMVRFTVTDEGPGYDPSSVPPPNFSNPTDGGYGVHLMRETMSKVSYYRGECCNELMLDMVTTPEDSEVS